MSKIKKVITHPQILIEYSKVKLLEYFSKICKSDKTFLNFASILLNGKTLDLDNPKTYVEKLNWLKVHYHDPMLPVMVDKATSKDFVTSKLGSDKYIIPTLGVWDKFEDIDFDKLPNEFVLKCTHDSHSVIVCKDKGSLDKPAVRRYLSKRLKRNFYHRFREWPYKSLKPQIIAEKFMRNSDGSPLMDYKFFCFNGVPKVMYISDDNGENPACDFFDMNFNHLDIRMRDPNAKTAPKKPEKFEEMRQIAEKLSAGLPHARIDMYLINGEIYFGEITFYHNGGFQMIRPDRWNHTFGEWIDLSDLGVASANQEH